jgi:prepilin peptidase CpaA
MIRDILLLSLFPGAMALAAASDLFTMRVPNALAIVLAAGFFLAAPLAGLEWPEIGLHLGLAAIALATGFSLFAFGWIGGGDAKLFAATCLWLGPDAILTYAVYAALIGGVLTLALLYWRAMPLPAPLASQNWLMRLHRPNEGVPYAIALAASGLLVYPHTPFMAALGA